MGLSADSSEPGASVGPNSLLLVSVAFLLLATGASQPVHAATQVAQPVQIGLVNGGPTATITLSGCNVSPGTVTSGGSAQTVMADESCAISAMLPSGMNNRYQSASGSSSLTINTCAAPGPCATYSATLYYQLQNTYQAAASAQASFDTGMTWAVTGTVLGASSAAVCTISSTAAATDSCSGWADYNSAVSFPAQSSSPPANSRWQGAGALTFTDTTGGNTHSVNYYKQWRNTFRAVANAQSAFDAGLSAAVTANSLGASATICTISPIVGQGSGSCAGYSDNGAVATLPGAMAGAAADTRWVCGLCTTPSLVAGGQTLNVNYYKQVSEQFAYSISDSSALPSSAVLTCQQLGASASCASLSKVGATYWLDFGSSWSATNPVGGATERWSSQSATGTAAAGGQTTIAYYHQYSLSVGYTVVGGGSPPVPTVTYLLYGGSTSAAVTVTGSSFWMDSGQSFTVAATSLVGAGERWASPITSYPVSRAGSVTITLYHQYGLTLSYAVVGGGTGYAPPTLTYSPFGASASVAFPQSPTLFWSDAGSSWAATNPLPGSGPSERWETIQNAGGAATSSLTSVLSYYHQYPVVFVYSVIGGGTGYGSPSVDFSEFGVRVSGTQGWADAGSAYSFANPLPGSSSTERWYSGDSVGSISATSPVNATYYHQYAFLLGYSVIGGGGYGDPSLNSSYLGTFALQRLSIPQATYWLDSGSKWSVGSLLAGSDSTQRWSTNQASSGAVLSSVTNSFVYYQQFLSAFAYSVVGGGSPKAPLLTYTSYGQVVRVALSTPSNSFWIDSASRWEMPLLLPGSTHEERWITNSFATGTVAGPLSEDLAYIHQYYLDSRSNSVSGGSFADVTQWYSVGTRVTLNATASGGWRFIYWKGAGSGSYNGTQPVPSISVDGPANETAIFYAGLTLHPDANGYLTYSFGSVSGNASAGSERTVYLPPGTNVSLKATPGSFAYIFAAWAGDAKGGDPRISLVVLRPQSVSASFVLDYQDISVVAVAIPVVVILSTYILAVRRWPRGHG